MEIYLDWYVNMVFHVGSYLPFVRIELLIRVFTRFVDTLILIIALQSVIKVNNLRSVVKEKSHD